MASASLKSLSSIFSTSKPKLTKSVPSSSSAKSHEIIQPQTMAPAGRREFLKKGLSMILPLTILHTATPPPHSEAREIEVGSYLPPSPSDPSFVLFKASQKDTPALRAGNVSPYQFIIPPSWKQLRIANILSGNYCQPKCAEPWIEVKFEDEKQGKVQVVASPLIRLTNKPNATIEDIGSPEKVIGSLGQFVTGNTFDSDELLESSVEKIGDQTGRDLFYVYPTRFDVGRAQVIVANKVSRQNYRAYVFPSTKRESLNYKYYNYVLETPYALTGSHNLAKATAKGNTVILFVASASDKQWPTSQKTLKAMVDSFQV